MKVTLVIPNYNNSANLRVLIPQVLEQNFDEVIVIDDASTDDSLRYLNGFPQIKTLRLSENKGPTIARNQILKEKPKGIICFIDSDMRLQTPDIPDKIRTLYARYPGVGVIGGLILDKTTQKPMRFNYGREFSFKVILSWVGDVLSHIVYRQSRTTFPASGLRRSSQNVDWVAEGVFIVRADIFYKLNGFDERFKMFHEGPDLCKRVRGCGYQILHTTLIRVYHLNIHNVTGVNRRRYKRSSTWYYIRKHWRDMI